MNKVVALIPARKNSTRIKSKNLKKILKQPLIWWTLIAAKKSKYIDEIYVSSDSHEILNFSKKQKAKIIKRPKKFSNNFATKKQVINHALGFLKKKESFLIILFIYNQLHHLELVFISIML